MISGTSNAYPAPDKPSTRQKSARPTHDALLCAEGEGPPRATSGGPMNPYDALYSWAASDRSGHGIGGVTNEPEQASRHLTDALKALNPGACGHVQVVHLVWTAEPGSPFYAHGAMLRQVGRGVASGELPPGGGS